MNVLAPKKSTSPVNVDERKGLPIKAGDIVRVHQKIKEKGKIRIQIFEGLVLARKHGTEAGATFTVRATLSGVGVEKIFPLYSPSIDKIEIVRRSQMRRAKLYYVRDQVAREMRRSLRNMINVAIATKSEREEADKAVAEAEALKAAQEAQAKADAEKEAAEAAAKAEKEKAEAEAAAPAPETAEAEAPKDETKAE
ncbi:50S ribosomal protein L19 [Patescibacteria group bacterium]|nr:50S ribosomal protein L19 [Patescibacteria group bacterium]